MNKFAPFFERQIACRGTGFLVRTSYTYSDVLLFEVLDQVVRSDNKCLSAFTHLAALYTNLGNEPRMKAFLESDKRKSKSQDTILAYRAAYRKTHGL